MKNSRLAADKRRESILCAVAPLFARHGLGGVTTRQLAAAAGVSEALLFRHFSDKRSLYTAASKHILPVAPFEELVSTTLPPSARRLALTIHRLAERLTAPDNEIATRQLCLSLTDDGGIAREHLAQLAKELLPSLREDLHAAYVDGDNDVAPAGDTELWLAQHLLLGLQLCALPERAVLDYHSPRFELLQRCVRFILRGLGLNQSAIERDYLPELLNTPPSR